MAHDPIDEIPLFIRRIMPHASEAQLAEAAENFKEYMTVVWQIHRRLAQDRLDSDSPKS
jgi:hypothetical protein